jgi:ribosomal protein L29
MKDVTQLRQNSDQQLKDRLNELAISLQRAHGLQHIKADFTMMTRIKGDTMFLKRLKREKAQILTILRERELKRMEKT